jgi:hypothetical protein
MNAIKVFYMAMLKENIPIYGVVRFSSNSMLIIDFFASLFKATYRDKSFWVNIQLKKKMYRKVYPEFHWSLQESHMKILLTWINSKDQHPHTLLKRNQREQSQ